LIVFPFCWISFSNIEASMAPARNLFSGFGMQITSVGTGNTSDYLFFSILNSLAYSIIYKKCFLPLNKSLKFWIIGICAR
jgi:hypothetical protein